MSAQIISGTEMARQIREELRQEVAGLKQQHGLVPALATVLVGEDPASRVYVGQKGKDCLALGLRSEGYELPEDTTEAELLSLVAKLNKDPNVHGILVQAPLPSHISESRVFLAVDPKKDVDGFHPINVGKLITGEPDFIPCTPHGVQQMLIRSGIETEGAEVVVVGRSNIVGKPVANLLLQKGLGANATVTICHTRTKDLAFHTRRADILIVALGKPRVITADMVKEGVVVIDVGINRIGKSASGKDILVGDVDFEAVKEKARAITPVPGGVGPMTRAMLMVNTVRAAKLSANI